MDEIFSTAPLSPLFISNLGQLSCCLAVACRLSGQVSADVPGGLLTSGCGSETIRYPASSHSPKSISLHLLEQKGKNSAFWSSPGDNGPSKILLQIGHLYFISKVNIPTKDRFVFQEDYSSFVSFSPWSSSSPLYSYFPSCSFTTPFSTILAYSTQYLVQGVASSRALEIGWPVPSQMP